ncbi:hypothetical protein B0A48_11031 [Cryoendolithus antarcticus]|uniref:NADH:flavin oxidoreductase/NADH oxidase N-terminal domain-containing protein n=1 Tax=Cryoendolithus antarcticus TaxID=1507870 RepID=A0A1V8SUK2_9PEZI|nr:hypothetical protein B0A48_11031 [Cryoendolithus antarcticus]
MAFNPISLPNGSTIKNRIVKAAMEESMADVELHCQPSRAMIKLYDAWGAGGSGLILSGHVMIDPLAMALAGDTLLAEDAGPQDDQVWRTLISKTKAHGAQFWLQINHPGRQVKKQAGIEAYGPSDVQVKMGRLSALFGQPIAMSEEKIQDIIHRFAYAARKAEELGADGVEVHAAHGYLISAFLSPLANVRTDRWGGSRENRARLLFEVLKAVRANVSPTFGVAVKINSSDFQKGGFDSEDLLWIVKQLNTMHIDFIEISGGNYESPAMAGSHMVMDEKTAQSSTTIREMYFFEAAKQVEQVATMPVVVTGGIRKRATLDAVVASSDRLLAGVGTAIGLIPDLPNRWQRGEDPSPSTSPTWVLPKMLVSIASIAAVHWNMAATGGQGRAWQGVWPVIAFGWDQIRDAKQTKQYQKWAKGLVEARAKL